jgi:hypothetical protein
MVFYIIAFGLGVVNFALCSKISRGPGVFQRLLRGGQKGEKGEDFAHNLDNLKQAGHRPKLEEFE